MLLYQQYLFVYRLVSAYMKQVVQIKKNKLKYPNFSAFVNKVTKEYTQSECYRHYSKQCFRIDGHWRPFICNCLYCDIPYHVIGRMETFEEDVRYILLKNNLTQVIPLKETSMHFNKSNR